MLTDNTNQLMMRRLVLEAQAMPASEQFASSHLPAVLEVQAIEKSYGSVKAVQGVSLKIEQGEIFGLLGPNGAGKTTLISTLAGILTPDAGNAIVCGYDLVKECDRVKQVVSLVPQDLTLYQELSAIENLTFFAHMYHLSNRQIRQRIGEVLEIVQLAEVAKKRVQTYSGGMKRRLNLAIGLLNQPKLLFLDEPTAGVDPQSRNHIFECLRELVRECHMSVFYTTHYMEEAQALCNRVAIYDHGQIVAQGTPHELMRSITAAQLTLRVRDLPWSLLEQIRQLPSVQRAEYSEGTLYLAAPELAISAFDTMTILQKQGVAVVEMQTHEVTLETVFLTLTGRALRE